MPIDARGANDELQAAYRQTFATPMGRRVLADLIAYCHARKVTFDHDPRMHAFKDGQRDVFLRVQEFMSLTLEEIYALRTPAPRQIQQDDE